MIQRKTQTAEYWQDFTLTPQDVDFLRSQLLESERPVTSGELAAALVAERVRREEAEIRSELQKGKLFQPRNTYEVGDKILFPALDFRLGEVTSIREGKNPEYGAFHVISVDFGSNRRPRNFAARLAAPHKLNADPSQLLQGGDAMSPTRLLEGPAANVRELLREQLATQDQFAQFEDNWILRDLLAEVHVGHLNIAEAAVDMRSQPIETQTLLHELDLPAEIAEDVRAFSLNSALAADGRFDQVGTAETRRWYLRRLEPAEALAMPEALKYEPEPYERGLLTHELLQFEWELDDEWADESASTPAPFSLAPSTTLMLTYPHLISGTLPLTGRARSFFAIGHGERTMVTLIDGRWMNRFSGFVVPDGRYIAGLRPWFDQHKLPAGAYIVLERREDPNETVVDFRPKRMRREWMRMAQVTDDNRLDFQMRKQAVSCEYDEQVIIGVEDVDAVQRLRQDRVYRDMPLRQLVYQTVVDLAGLSQQGTAHAKTVYSAVNVVRRCPPGPIFAAMVEDKRIQSAGDGFYRLAAEA